jgi:hypothetical protein
MQISIKNYTKGLASFVPGLRNLFCSSSGGTVSARYCYSVWLRHLVSANNNNLIKTVPKVIAELGPGDSLGIGLCAVLCGSDRYYAFDIKEHANFERNKVILIELLKLFQNRENIPGDQEFPSMWPKLDDYSFPDKLLSVEAMNINLSNDRIGLIIKALQFPKAKNPISIGYIAPWGSESISVDDHESVEMIISQAVMEHVADVKKTYEHMYKWLTNGGITSHAIDYRSHGYTRDWNGHWFISSLSWKILKGGREYFINRLPHSAHIAEIKNARFKIKAEICNYSTTLSNSRLSKDFIHLSKEDLETSGAFIQAIK